MYSRSDSVTLTVQERFAFSSGVATRSTRPEVFTFERIPPQATAVRSYVPIRPKKRCTRVMYPAKVRMHLPPPERSAAKRWLLVLCLVVLWQIYTEEPCVDAPLGADGSISSISSISDYQGFSLQSAEQEARSGAPGRCEEAAQQSDSSGFEQSAGKSMVALLVYHTLGNDN